MIEVLEPYPNEKKNIIYPYPLSKEIENMFTPLP